MWTIPFAKIKQRTFREGIKELKGKPHFVPLSKQAVKLLRDLKDMTGGALAVPRNSRAQGAHRQHDHNQRAGNRVA
jgi:integrase